MAIALLPRMNILLSTGPNNNVPIDDRSNIIFIHIQDLFHERTRNLNNSYHFVESDSFNSKRIVMVNYGAFELNYRGVLRYSVSLLADHFHVKLARVFCLYLINPYFPSPTQSLEYPLLSRSYIALFERFCQKQILKGVDFEIQIEDQNIFSSNGHIGFWFQEGLSFPKLYLVTNLHKKWADAFYLT